MNNTLGGNQGPLKRSRVILIGGMIVGLPIVGFLLGRGASSERPDAIDTRLPKVVAPQGDLFADKLLEKRDGLDPPEDKMVEGLEKVNRTLEEIRSDAFQHGNRALDGFWH